MRFNNSFGLAAALALSACGGGRSLPPAPQAGYPQQYPQQYPQPSTQDFPTSVDPRYAGPGTSYPAPSPRGYPATTPTPARDLDAQNAYDPQGGYQQPGTAYPPPGQGYPAYPPQGSAQTGYPQQPSNTQPAYPQPSYPQPGGQMAAMPPPSSGQLPPEQRYDQVGYAGWAAQAGTVAAAHRTVPPGAFVEVTALDTGKTVLVPITARAASSREIELSGAAAQLLGLQGSGPAAVRVRRVLPSVTDQTRLRAGQPAEPRYDTPPVLLRALRSRLAGMSGGSPATAAPLPSSPGASYAPPAGVGTAYRPAPRPAPVRGTPQGPAYYVQLAALSNNANAARLARDAGAAVRQGNGLFLVRAGPFADLRTAQAARDDFAGRGYADARIVRE